MTGRWHVLREAGGYTLARRLPVRWDLWVDVRLPLVRPVRLAHQIRQDIWRALRGLRGFSPIVRLCPDGGGWLVRAGGQALGSVAVIWRARLATVLNCEENHLRWCRHAGRWGGAGGHV